MSGMQIPRYAFECNIVKRVKRFGFVTKVYSCRRRFICQCNIWPSLKLWNRPKTLTTASTTRQTIWHVPQLNWVILLAPLHFSLAFSLFKIKCMSLQNVGSQSLLQFIISFLLQIMHANAALCSKLTSLTLSYCPLNYQ